MWPVGIRIASAPSRRRAHACSSVTKFSSPRTVIWIWQTRRANCSSCVGMVLIIEPTHCNRTSAVLDLKKSRLCNGLSIVAQLLSRFLSSILSRGIRGSATLSGAAICRAGPCPARLHSCRRCRRAGRWSAGHGPRDAADLFNYQGSKARQTADSKRAAGAYCPFMGLGSFCVTGVAGPVDCRE